MTKLTKAVFLTLLGTMVAMVLYFVLFGTPAGQIAGVLRWDETYGAIYNAGRFVETPIAKYYYEYSYIPNSHANDYIDMALGGTLTISSVYETDPDLSFDNEFIAFNGTYQHWSTGWK